MRDITAEMRALASASEAELMRMARDLGAPFDLVQEVASTGKLPVVNFAAGGLATPADAALMMQLGCDGVFVGSGIFKSENPAVRARAIVEATTFYDDPAKIAKVSRNLGGPMTGIEIDELIPSQRYAQRGN